MKKSKFSESQIVGILKEVELGAKVGETCRKHGISEPTHYKWKSQFSGMTVSHLPPDADALRAFVHSLTQKKEGSVLLREGQRKMIDLCELSKKVFFHASTHGSNSIKKVLPAMLNASEFLEQKYSQPIYGGSRPNSKNFIQPMAWWQADASGKAVDPYQLLPKVFEDLEVTEVEEDETALNQGGAAIIAYARLQAEDISPQVRLAWERALLKYCELDTLAMAMVVEGWQDWTQP